MLFNKDDLSPYYKPEFSELGEHCATCGGNTSMILKIINCVKEGEHDALNVLESYWQKMLAT